MITKRINFKRAQRDFAYDPETGALIWRSGKMRGKTAGCKNKHGYLVVDWQGSKWYAHRLALAIAGSTTLVGDIVDHSNYRKTDNSLSNLVPGTMRDNVLRRRGRKRKLRYQGIERRQHSWGVGYRATIIVKGKKLHGRGTRRAVDAYRDYLRLWVEHNGIESMCPQLASDFLRLCA